MCGIAGFWGGGWGAASDIEPLMRRMGDSLAHRGPDAEGYWADAAQQLAFVHRRLSIVDLSSAGAQPMRSARGRFVMTFNGEIYNHRALRQDLAADWRGNSDTEVMLAAFEAWGIEATVRKCVGMFAFAVWDRDTSSLTLGRDRLGEKPLYYGWQGSGRSRTFMFGSELKALSAHPSFAGEIDREALCHYMRYGNVGSPLSIYRGIAKLPPATTLTLDSLAGEAKPIAYWSVADAALDGSKRPFEGSEDDAISEVERAITAAVRQQMVSDVPLGAFLSGGVDSSLITALMQSQSQTPVRTFSIGFREDDFDEARHARAVAAHLGTSHAELYCTAEQALDLVPSLPAVYDEPFADSSQLPTLLLANLTRRHVTVALSGDGGDEVFCGYNRYRITNAAWRQLSHVPEPLRRLTATLIHAMSPDAWDGLARRLPFSARWARVGEKMHKGAQVLSSRTVGDLHRGLLSHWADPGSVVLGAAEPPLTSVNSLRQLSSLNDVEKMMVADMVGYLTDDILVKVDRAAMAASLETRVPFLDHRVVELAWRLPMNLKLRNGETKWILRQALYRRVPRPLLDRPKVGFAVPIGQWLRGPLREWAEDLLSESRLRQQGYFAPGPIRTRWIEHLKGARNWESSLWVALMFQAWLARA